MYYADKPKVFIRFYPGASGHFIALLLQSLTCDVTEPEDYTAHIHSPIVYSGHNFKEQFRRKIDIPGHTNEFLYYLSYLSSVDAAVTYLQTNYRFTETNNIIYTIPTHATQPEKLIAAFPTNLYNTKLINIEHSLTDIQQISYNNAAKGLLPWKRIDLVEPAVKNILKRYPEKAKNPKFNIDESVFEDLRFLCYLLKFTMVSPGGFYDRMSENTLSLKSSGLDYINIPFSSIDNLKLISYIDDIVDYVGIETTRERKRNALNLLIKYSKAQKPNPYTDLHIDDY
jgi:hypothetical protein